MQLKHTGFKNAALVYRFQTRSLSVPKFLINGKEPQGGRNVENYSAIIDAELKKK